MKKLLFITFIFYGFLYADIAPRVLEKYQNNIFVCTRVGSCRDVEMALRANFAYIHGVEQDKVLADHSHFAIPVYIRYIKPKKFKNYFIYHSNCTKQVLSEIINPITKPCTILLNSYLPEIDHPEKENFILQELDAIKNHSIKRHTILIDYIHLAGTQYFGNISLETVQKKLLKINPQYKFKFEMGGHLRKEENAILVAYL